MTSWIILVGIAQFFSALVVLGDKFLVSDHQLKSPSAYAFYVSILSAVVLFLIPFGVIHIPSGTVIALSLIVAISYILSIMGLYTSLRVASASEVMPIVGGVSAISTFLIKHYFFGEIFTKNFLIGSFFLVVGMVLVSHFRFPKRIVSYMFFSGVLFAVSSVLVKEIFSHTDFVNGFFWTRMANVFGALLLLLIPGNMYAIFHKTKNTKTHTTFLLLGNKILGAVAFIIVLYAISIGNVSVINALSALQYLFLFVIAILLAHRFPKFFGDEITRHEILHKITAMGIILIGFFVLFN